MAAWQFSVSLQPEFMPLPADYSDLLDAMLPRGCSWSPQQETWGEDDGDTIQIFRDPRASIEIYVRFDVRSLTPARVDSFAAFMRTIRRRPETPDGLQIEPSSQELTLAIQGSPAWRFCEDPVAFLRRVSLGGIDDA